MNRQLQPELLDELPPTDPRAIHSRRDLHRINAIMRNPHFLNKFLKGGTPLSERSRPAQNGPPFSNEHAPTSKKITLLEIGAGDGNIAFQLARAFSHQNICGTLLLLDRQSVIDPSTHIPNWTHEVIEADLFNWLPTAPRIDITIANLFLHHFQDTQLQTLFSALSKITKVFVACEPRRNKFALFFARNVWLIGCNQVTCHDAEISVRAGFRDRELSALWPQSISPRPAARGERIETSNSTWRLTEHRAGLFTHFFAAIRTQ